MFRVKLMFYEFEVGHNAVEVTKNICWAKCKTTSDHHTRATRLLKKFCSICMNDDDQMKSGLKL